MRFAPLIAIGVMSAAGFTVASVGPVINPPDTPAGLEMHETHASASLLGQFRTSVSSWLWLRTDLYLHNGVEMRPMTDGEKGSGVKTEDAADDGHEKLIDESAVLTIIPSKDRDFRGILGDIERATNAYKDMHGHTHNDPIATLPLFRLMTWIDPGFIPGWVTGASVISREQDKAGALKAINYLSQGLTENPQSISILVEIGQLYARRMNNLHKAAGYLEQARRIGKHRDAIMVASERDALDQAYRWLGLCYRDLGYTDRMMQVAEEGLKLYKDDRILARLANEQPMILKPTPKA